MALGRDFYERHSFGAVPIEDARDLPTLKIRSLMAVLAKRANRRARLLELGSGSGRILASIEARDPALRLAGIDISHEQTRQAHRASPDIDHVIGNAEELPFADQAFEFVIIMDFLEHIERPQRALAEACRVLKPGGVLFAAIPAEGHGIYRLGVRVLGRHIKEETIGHIQRFTKTQIEDMVGRAGFEVRDVTYSYHILGSVLDYVFFTLLLNDKIAAAFWSKGKYYQGRQSQTVGSRVLNALMTLGNAIAYYESSWLRRVRLTATAVCITALKRG